MSNLKECPCGLKPKKLIITANGEGTKLANVSGDCCDEWMLEFRANYYQLQSKECMQLAIEAWNSVYVKSRSK